MPSDDPGDPGAFRSTAPFYDLFAKPTGRLDREGPLLLETLARAPGPRLLDLACGTGLHARFLAERGAVVTALDASPAMIAYAQQTRSHPHITFQEGTMTAPAGGPWDMAICLGNSLSLLDDPDRVAQAFATIAGHLTPGAPFLLQVLNYQSEAAAQPRHRIERKQSGEADIIAIKNLVPASDRTLLNLAFFEQRGPAIRRFTESAVLLHLTEPQLTATATSAGFTSLETFGGFDASPYQPRQSTDLVMRMVKAPADGAPSPQEDET